MTSEKTRVIPPSAESAATPQDMGHAPTAARARGIKRTRAGELWVAAGFFAAILLARLRDAARPQGHPGREAAADPDVFADKTIGQVAGHYAAVIGRLSRKPAVIGHSFGGLLAQIIAGRGLSAATVAIDAAPFRGILQLPLSSLKASRPSWATRPTGIARSRSATTSFGTHSLTPSMKTKPGGSTTPSPSPPPAHPCSRRRPPTSTRTPKPRSTP